MYDTLHFSLPNTFITEKNYQRRIVKRLCIQDSCVRNGVKYWEGNYRNLKVRVSENGLNIKGSICKFLLGVNLRSLTLNETKDAIQALSENLSLPLETALIRRVDIAENFFMTNPPELYYKFLGSCVLYKRLEQPQSLYYQNSQRVKLFYNKKAEVRSKQATLPKGWEDKNVLRYELRFINRLSRQFNYMYVKASQLYDNVFFENLVKRYAYEYERISKLSIYIPKIEQAMTASQSQKLLFAALIAKSGHLEVLNEISLWNKAGLYSTKREYYRAVKEIKAIMKKIPTEKNEFIIELNNKVSALRESLC